MIKHVLLLNIFCSIGLIFGGTKNYYIIDGRHEDNSVVKLWYTALGLLDEYDKGLNAGFAIVFNQEGKHFSAERGSNWWDYYFACNAVGSPEDGVPVRVPRYKRSTIRFNTVCTMSPTRAHYLLNRYMPLQPAVQERLNHIKAVYWPDDIPVIGVYYQNPIMPEVQQSWDPIALCKRVEQEAEQIGPCKILLFTHLEGFAATLNDYFGSRCDYISCLKNNAQTTPAQCGEHELLTVLLLAQCDTVIASGSYQGIGAKMLNPDLQLKELDTIPYALE
jgi:hypothetical protein